MLPVIWVLARWKMRSSRRSSAMVAVPLPVVVPGITLVRGLPMRGSFCPLLRIFAVLSRRVLVWSLSVFLLGLGAVWGFSGALIC